MSLHKSLRSKTALARRRNVLSRAERVQRLMREEKFDPGKDSVYGLPKVKPYVVEGPAVRHPRHERAEQQARPEGEQPPEGQ